MTKEIQLTRGKVALVDDADYEWLKQYKWQAQYKSASHNTWYASRSIRVNGKSKAISMHREILGVTDPKIEVDHQDGDGLHNERHNLRECNHSQNMKNLRRVKTGKYGYKGVSKRRDWRKWCAQIHYRGKNQYLGGYDTPEDAARAYDKAAKEYFGEFANLNFPEN